MRSRFGRNFYEAIPQAERRDARPTGDGGAVVPGAEGGGDFAGSSGGWRTAVDPGREKGGEDD